MTKSEKLRRLSEIAVRMATVNTMTHGTDEQHDQRRVEEKETHSTSTSVDEPGFQIGVPQSRDSDATSDCGAVCEGVGNMSDAIDEVGEVYAVMNRKFEDTYPWYLVQWKDREDGFRWPDAWLPGYRLREDGFSESCDLVDKWKLSGNPCFYGFCRKNGYASILGGSEDKQCAVNALAHAARLIGIKTVSVRDCFEHFRDECKKRGRELSSQGLSYGQLRKLITIVNSACSASRENPISLKTFDRNKVGGINGKVAPDFLRSFDMCDGVYMCACFNSMRVSHCFVIQVLKSVKYVYDEERVNVEMARYDAGWIVGISFLRRLEIYTKG